MLPLPLLLFRLFMSLLIMEQCAGDSSESRKCLNLSSSSHQYTAAGERRFTTTQCTMSLSTLLWNEWTRIKETLTIKFMLLGHFGELQQASLESVLFLSYYFIYHIFSFNVQLSLHTGTAAILLLIFIIFLLLVPSQGSRGTQTQHTVYPKDWFYLILIKYTC